MPATTRAPAGSYSGAPVVHLHQPPAPPPPAWQVPAIAGMLSLQFCLLALIAWKLVDPGGGTLLGNPAPAVELADLKEAIAARAEADAALEKVRLRTQMLDEFAAEMRGTTPGFVERMQDKFDQTQRLNADVEARAAQVTTLQAEQAALAAKLGSVERKATSDQERLQNTITSLRTSIDRLTDEREKLAAKLEVYEPKVVKKQKSADEQTGEASRWSVWWYVGGGVLAAVILGTGVWFGGRLLNEKNENEDGPPDEPGPPSETDN